MWMGKLASGILCVVTPLGPRYINPSFPQRILLLWIFRHFHTLPQNILSGWQQSLTDTLCAEHKFVSLPHDTIFEVAPIIGTIERRAAAQAREFPEHRVPFGLSDSFIARWLGLRPRS
jgi:hypothetical protein